MIIEQQAKLYQQKMLERIKASDWTWEEACEMGLAARNLRDLANWVIGQIAFHIQIKWGEKNLSDFANLLGLHRATIEQYRWVIGKFGEDYQPMQGLPWAFYRLAAGTEKPHETLQKIADEQLSYREAQLFVKGNPIPRECKHDYEEYNFIKCKLCGHLIRRPENFQLPPKEEVPVVEVSEEKEELAEINIQDTVVSTSPEGGDQNP